MNQHLGASYTLSVLIVVACAICLRGYDTPSNKHRVPGPAVSFVEKSERPRVRTVSHLPVHRDETPTLQARPEPARERSIVKTIAQAQPRVVTSAREPFTRVGGEETLEEVAQRVYGSTEALENLWKANRDQLDTTRSAVRPGMVLRTP